MVCEAAKDARGPVVGYPFQGGSPGVDEPARKKARLSAEEGLPETFKKHGPRFEAILAKNEKFDEAPGILASGLTVADVYLGELAHEMMQMNDAILQPYPKLEAVRQRILGLPGVKA